VDEFRSSGRCGVDGINCGAMIDILCERAATTFIELPLSIFCFIGLICVLVDRAYIFLWDVLSNLKHDRDLLGNIDGTPRTWPNCFRCRIVLHNDNLLQIHTELVNS
jgi:hypothetical protein